MRVNPIAMIAYRELIEIAVTMTFAKLTMAYWFAG
jgi:hypothetical protein